MRVDPPFKTIVPGVLPFPELVKNLARWDDQERTVKIFGRFYKGAELKLYPIRWLELAMERAEELDRMYGLWRPGRAIGVDPAEGGDSSSWTVGDLFGFIEQQSMKTPDTTVVVEHTLELMREYKVPPENVVFDRGGGGKEHADVLRKMGYPVRTVGFGEGVTPEKRTGMTPLQQRKEQEEERYAYVNRRAEMYGMLSEALNPFGMLDSEGNPKPRRVYGIPSRMTALLDQLEVIPKLRDKEGRLFMLPKNKPPGSENSNVRTLVDIIGHSPDEADSAVLCYYGLRHKALVRKAGALH